MDSRDSTSSTVGAVVPVHHARHPSLLPNLASTHVEVVLQGWLNKQGGAKGGRKSWKRRWFILKEDCLYYKESPDSLVLLGVMPVHGSHLLDLGGLTQSAPPAPIETQTVCHECKRPFTFLDRKHHCRHCGNTFCAADSSRRIAIPKFGLHTRVRVCDGCYTAVATELEGSEVVLKLLELTGERPEETVTVPSAPSSPTAGLAGGHSMKNTITAHAQAMQQLKHRAAVAKATADAVSTTSPPPAAHKRSSLFRGGGTPVTDTKRFTLPSVNKPHLFALKNSERELWLHADNAETRAEWVQAIRGVQRQKDARPRAPSAADPQAAAAPSWEIPYPAVSVLNKVGVGAFGEVFRARLWGTEVACKTLKTEQFKDADALLEDLKKEVSILSTLRHPNVVLYIGACTAPPNVCILTEWCARGSLHDVLHDYSVHLPSKLCVDLAQGIAQGMNYLHSLSPQLIHRDLKSHNILVGKAFQVKVADFGLSHVRELQAKGDAEKDTAVEHKGPRHYGIFGTPEWMAPEVMEGSPYTEKVDVYSFGILLSELVSRQMPFHDLGKITCYMDVVDLVLDQAAIPTIPRWCEGLFGGLIRACLNRIPSERPSFTDIILRLREVAELDDSIYFFAFDLPRLRELITSSTPGIQSLAASELAALLADARVRRRTSPIDAASDAASAAMTLSPFKDSSSVSSPAGGSFGSDTSSSSISSNTATPAAPTTAANAATTMTMTMTVDPLSPLPMSPSDARATNLGGLSSPLMTGPGWRPTHVEGAYWILSDEDAFDFLERCTSLLSSSHREVQLNSCRALHTLLSLSAGDRGKRALDRELVVSCGGLGALLALLVSEQTALATAAAQTLLLLTEDLTPAEQGAFVGLTPAGLIRLRDIVAGDIDADERALEEMRARIRRKREVLGVVATSAKDAPLMAHVAGVDALHATPVKKPRANGRRSLNPVRFVPGGATPSLLSGAGGAGPIQLRLAINEGVEEDSDDDAAISAHVIAAAAAQSAKHSASTRSRPSDPWHGAPQRVRSATAQPISSAPGSAANSALGSVANASAHDSPVSPALVDLFVKLGELLTQFGANSPYPEKFEEWYGNIVRACYTLRYDLEADAWHVCYALLLPDELRLFNDTTDEPDEPLLIIRTRAPDPDSDVPGAFLHAKVRVGHKHGMPFCFQVEDCGRIFTFCSGDAKNQEAWRAAITGKPNSTDATGQSIAIGAGNDSTVPHASLAHPTAADGDNASRAVGNGGMSLVAASVSVGGQLLGPPPEDPTLGRDIPVLDIPTPPFAKRYRDITFHGYLMLRDRDTPTVWTLKYMLLVGGTTLRVFDSHRSSPNDPWAEHEIDPAFTDVNASERRVRRGANEFFIRLHSSSVQFDCWAASAEEKAKWIVALCGDRFISPAAASAGQANEEQSVTTSSSTDGSRASTSSLTATIIPSRVAAFAAYYGKLDYYGFLYRRRKLTNRWNREFVCLVDSEVHYYTSLQDPVDQPSGTFYIATNSGKAFHVKQSSKRAHCIGVVNPSRTFYLAAETEKEYLGWVNALHQTQKYLARRAQPPAARPMAPSPE